ncbi:MAG: LysR family transcriptional activator of nhaA [Bacteriovoracaceae bacterium]|jgi:LysR family transcriptional activator of nhaA
MYSLNTLNLNHLYYFWVIAKEGSIRKAAESLHLTQPTLSDQIKTLEERLGKKVFERHSNKIHITTIGRQIFEHCSVMFQEGEKIINLVRSDEDKLFQMRVGILPDISKHLACDIFTPIIQSREAFVYIEEGEYKYLLQSLESGAIDFILVNEKDKKFKGLYLQKTIKENKFLVVCRKKLVRKKSHTQLMKSLPYISYTKESSLYLPIDSYLKKKDITPKTICEVDDVALIKLFTLSSDSFSVLPESVVQEEIKNGSLIVLAEIPKFKRGLTLIAKKLDQNRKMLKILEDHLINDV